MTTTLDILKYGFNDKDVSTLHQKDKRVMTFDKLIKRYGKCNSSQEQ